MADKKSFTVQASNYHINVNVKHQNLTVIITFPRNADSGISEVAVVFVDKTPAKINPTIHKAGRRLIKEMPNSFSTPVIDMLRNEKPIFVRCGYTRGARITSESFDFFTHLENIGEEDN